LPEETIFQLIKTSWGLEKCDTLVFFLLAVQCSLARLILLSALFIAVLMQYLVRKRDYFATNQD